MGGARGDVEEGGGREAVEAGEVALVERGDEAVEEG